jgi:hypothetical protein
MHKNEYKFAQESFETKKTALLSNFFFLFLSLLGRDPEVELAIYVLIFRSRRFKSKSIASHRSICIANIHFNNQTVIIKMGIKIRKTGLKINFTLFIHRNLILQIVWLQHNFFLLSKDYKDIYKMTIFESYLLYAVCCCCWHEHV